MNDVAWKIHHGNPTSLKFHQYAEHPTGVIIGPWHSKRHIKLIYNGMLCYAERDAILISSNDGDFFALAWDVTSNIALHRFPYCVVDQ